MTPALRAHLDIGFRRPLHVREERLSSREASCRLLYISDIHLRRGRADRLRRQVVDAALRARPDAVLLGGDLVDSRCQLRALTTLVAALAGDAPVLAVGRNHDQQVGLDAVGEAVVRGGGRWIHDAVARVTHGRRVIAVTGPGGAPAGEADIRVLCAHNPRVWKRSRHPGYDLVPDGVPIPAAGLGVDSGSRALVCRALAGGAGPCRVPAACGAHGRVGARYARP